MHSMVHPKSSNEKRLTEWKINAMDSRHLHWVSDCRSFIAYMGNPNPELRDGQEAGDRSSGATSRTFGGSMELSSESQDFKVRFPKMELTACGGCRPTICRAMGSQNKWSGLLSEIFANVAPGNLRSHQS